MASVAGGKGAHCAYVDKLGNARYFAFHTAAYCATESSTYCLFIEQIIKQNTNVECENFSVKKLS